MEKERVKRVRRMKIVVFEYKPRLSAILASSVACRWPSVHLQPRVTVTATIIGFGISDGLTTGLTLEKEEE